ILGMGGSGGTSIATAAMRALPVGVPKLMLSTVGGGDVGPYTGTKDITFMPSVLDIAGFNRISRRIYTNAAAAIAGMVAPHRTPPWACRPCRRDSRRVRTRLRRHGELRRTGDGPGPLLDATTLQVESQRHVAAHRRGRERSDRRDAGQRGQCGQGTGRYPLAA